MTVLVAYASCHGSTRGIAERIGERLAGSGMGVEVRPVGEVHEPARYVGAVIGSAVHGGRWLPEASRFVDTHGAALRGRPVWLFSVSTIGDEESMFGPRVTRRLRALRGEAPEMARLRGLLRAVEHRNFAGRISSWQWPPAGRIFFRAVGGRYGDHRNWAAIDAWADAIGRRLNAPAGTAGRAQQA